MTRSAPAHPGGVHGVGGLDVLDHLSDALIRGAHSGWGIVAGFSQLCQCPWLRVSCEPKYFRSHRPRRRAG
jgi:hypothetical protein